MCDFIPFFISQLRGDIREAGQCVDGHVRKAQEVVKDAEMVLSENSIFIKVTVSVSRNGETPYKIYSKSSKTSA